MHRTHIHWRPPLPSFPPLYSVISRFNPPLPRTRRQTGTVAPRFLFVPHKTWCPSKNAFSLSSKQRKDPQSISFLVFRALYPPLFSKREQFLKYKLFLVFALFSMANATSPAMEMLTKWINVQIQGKECQRCWQQQVKSWSSPPPPSV